MKKLILTAVILLSQSAFSASTPVAYIYPFGDKPLPPYTDGRFVSHHEYHVYNETPTAQNFEVCYDLDTCDNYPQYERRVHDCLGYTAESGQHMDQSKDLVLVVNYPFRGTCHIWAKTEIKGFTRSEIVDSKTFEIK